MNSHSFVGGLTVVRKSPCNLLKQQKGCQIRNSGV